MTEEKKDEKKKKGPLSAIWESMNKTGGCCGTNEPCGCSVKKDVDKENKNKKTDKK